MPEPLEVLAWKGEVPGELWLLDQTRLPEEEVHRRCRNPGDLIAAFRELAVRGAPAIGVAAAFGAVLAAQAHLAGDPAAFGGRTAGELESLEGARPTAVNLRWALRRMRRVLDGAAGAPPLAAARLLLAEARRIQEEERLTCRRLGDLGAALLPDPARVLTHCNTGILATAGEGTALAAVYRAVAAGKRVEVFAGETRPLWQGLRLTAWELRRAGVGVTVLCDGAAGALLASGRVDAVLVGADRIARNGDFANKIGTYPLAVLARRHGVPFYVAAPASTFDLSLGEGRGIPIEERPAAEVLRPLGSNLAPAGTAAWNPAFDVTPGELVTAIVTERGVLRPPLAASIEAVLGPRPGGQEE